MKEHRVIKLLKVFALQLGIAGLSMTSAPAFANSPNGVQTILYVTMHDSGNAMVTFTGNGTNTEVCGTVTGGQTLVISKANPNFKMLYATALAAFLSNHPVNTWANGCVDIWGNGSSMAPQLTLVQIQ
jgi:hypothetical protein